MIFGYNTDVKSGDTVYHVQTEDRGEKHPVIDSVIYVKGRIVDRRRTPYKPGEHTAERLQELVKAQHRGLVDSIRDGTYVIPEHSEAPAKEAAGKSAKAPRAARAAGSAAGKVEAAEAEAAAPAAGTPADAGDDEGVPAAAPAGSAAETASAGGSAETASARPSLELTNARDLEKDGRLVFRLRVNERGNGRPLAGATVRAVLDAGEPRETRAEATAASDGIAEISFDRPSGGEVEVLFHAAAGGPAEVVKFRLRIEEQE